MEIKYNYWIMKDSMFSHSLYLHFEPAPHFARCLQFFLLFLFVKYNLHKSISVL